MTFEEKENDFKMAVFAFSEYKSIWQEFFDYWSEPNKSRSKMKWELEKTWDLNRRLKRWANNNFGFDKKEEPKPRPVVFNQFLTRSLPVPTQKEISEPDMWEWIKEEKNNKNLDLMFIPFMFYAFLESKKLITLTKENKLDAISLRRTQISKEITAKTMTLEYSSKFEKMVKDKQLTAQEKENLTVLAKRFALIEYLKR